MNKYEGKIVGDINKETFYRLEEEFNISFCKNKIEVLMKDVVKECDLIITLEENTKKQIIEKFDNEQKVTSLRELIGIEIEDLKGKNYEEHKNFVKIIKILEKSLRN